MGKFNVNVDELFRLKRDFENGIVAEEELSEPEHVALAYVYELEEEEFQKIIAMQEKEIEDYKIRLKEAIEYLKKRKNFEA
ncbi:MAG: hypothetical protein IKD74_03150 [Clostridia bacterium]|jgi:hypothetical protein|nr:hypothetical protein [Clostridia bacterium]